MGRHGKTGRTITNRERKARKRTRGPVRRQPARPMKTRVKLIPTSRYVLVDRATGTQYPIADNQINFG